jgi:transcriptional regulator with XRE-family HTH domain
LRREEVAALANVSSEWYTRLEQARDVRASESALRRIADALRLMPSEAKHLLTLGGYGQEPVVDGERNAALVAAHVQGLLDRLELCPAWVTDARSDILAWNHASSVIFGDLDAMPAEERNIYHQMFLTPRMRAMLVDWEDRALECVSRLRAMHARNVDEPWFSELVERLRRQSSEFERCWNGHEVQAPRPGVKEYDHPEAGRLTFDYTLLDVVSESDAALQLVAYVPTPASGTEQRMAALLAVSAAVPRILPSGRERPALAY